MQSLLFAAPHAAGVDVVLESLPDCRVEAVQDRESMDRFIRKKPWDLLFVDLDLLMDGADRTEVGAMLEAIWRERPSVRIVVMVEPQCFRRAVEAVRAGAGDYLAYPLKTEEVAFVVDSLKGLMRMESELRYLRRSNRRQDKDAVVESHNPEMRLVLQRLRQVAATPTTVLLTGETGTGKSLFARLVHGASDRAGKQFIAVHCGAIPENLVESELFGHEKGAFTGAVRRKLGKFEIADGGTIFLDEIGTVTHAVQIRLLQVLQDGTFQRVGGEANLSTDARVVAATNADLQTLTDSGDFRDDLFYRLNVFPVEIPPLRRRPEDIPLLCEKLLGKFSRTYRKPIERLHPAVLDAFVRYPWPGNVRELENLLERACIIATDQELVPEHFPSELFHATAPDSAIPVDTNMSLADFRERAKDHAEREYLTTVLTECKGRINRTAERAGVSPRQLHKLLTRHGIHKEDFKTPASGRGKPNGGKSAL